MTAATELRDRPAVPGSLLAVLAGIVAVAVVLDGGGQWQALAVTVAGLALSAAGYAAWHRDWQVGGLAVAAAGGLFVAAGLVLGGTLPDAITQRLELLPGLLGLAVLAAGLLPVRAGWERALVTTGTALLFLGVVTSGVVRGASQAELLVAGVAVVLSWDAGEQAVSLGGQVGRRARSHRATLAHAGGSLAAGVAILVTALVVAALDVQGLSLAGFAVLLVAGFALVVAMRH